MNCRNCGKELKDHQAFCVNCGTNVDLTVSASPYPQNNGYATLPVPPQKSKNGAVKLAIIMVVVAIISVVATLLLTGILFKKDGKDGNNAGILLENSRGESEAVSLEVEDEKPNTPRYSTYAVVTDIYISSYPKTQYYAGEELDLISGLSVVACYSDGTESELEPGDLFVEAPNVVKVGEYTARVSYGEHSVEFSFSITEADLVSVSIYTEVRKTSYYVGDKLNTSGLKLRATYKNGNTSIITDGFYCTPTVFKTAGTHTVTVSYQGKTAMFTVTVKAKDVEQVAVGRYITLGSYEQDNNTANGKESIEWRVLAVQNGKALVVSRYGLDCQPYNTEDKNVTWESCSLRAWLNGTFLNNAFSNEERAMIQSTTVENPDSMNAVDGGNSTVDRLFLLSVDEANKYFSSDAERMCRATAYAKARGADDNSADEYAAYCGWLLRTPGYYTNSSAYVYDYGFVNVYGRYVHHRVDTVRPAMWIDLDN